MIHIDMDRLINWILLHLAPMAYDSYIVQGRKLEM